MSNFVFPGKTMRVLYYTPTRVPRAPCPTPLAGWAFFFGCVGNHYLEDHAASMNLDPYKAL